MVHDKMQKPRDESDLSRLRKLPKTVWFLTVFGRFLSQGWSDCHWTNGLCYTFKISQHSYSLCKMKVRVAFSIIILYIFWISILQTRLSRKTLSLVTCSVSINQIIRRKKKHSNITITLLRLKWNIHQNKYDLKVFLWIP